MAEEGKSSSGVRVCITGGAVFIGSWLMRKLLEKCYIVHATLRNTAGRGAGALAAEDRPGRSHAGGWFAGGEEEERRKKMGGRVKKQRLTGGSYGWQVGPTTNGVKRTSIQPSQPLRPNKILGRLQPAKVGWLQPNPLRPRTKHTLKERQRLVTVQLLRDPEIRLRLFEADLVGAATFAPAIAGCQFVFLVATPYGLEAASSKYKSTAEAAVDAVRAILRQCEESKTVRRVIHIASLAAASQLKEPDAGAGAYKDFISESCWTPFNVDYPLRSAHFDKYILSKLQSEQELLSYNAGESPAFEAVTLPLGLVAGDTVLRRAPETLEHAVSPVSRNELGFAFLRLLQRLLGSLPLVHVDDACDALVFCMERRASIAGRFLCAAAYPTSHDVAGHFASKFPHLDILEETEAVVVRAQRAEDKLGGDS
uniref:NAD-dependent epimerase/dehydratase domain-containing protein n=1 Tax=Setaria italica TaxID=4555 RepID=K3XX55_SETIT